MLLLINTISKKNNKRQENAKIPNHNYHTQVIKYVQHKNVKMTLDDQKFLRHPVANENFKIIGQNTIILHYNYRVDQERGK